MAVTGTPHRARAAQHRSSLAPGRVVIEDVQPCVDGGRFPARRVIGELVTVEADLVADGHDEIAAAFHYRHQKDGAWRTAPMVAIVNDRWRGEFVVDRLGVWYFAISAGIDRFGTWRRDLLKKHEAGQDLAADLLIGAALLEEAAETAEGENRLRLAGAARLLRRDAPQSERLAAALDDGLATLAGRLAQPAPAGEFEQELEILVDPARARFSTWYEMFPRSVAADPDRHGTLRDVRDRLDYVAGMGFDILYRWPLGDEAWADTAVELPPEAPVLFTDCFGDRPRRAGSAALRLAELFDSWPVALLVAAPPT